MPLIHESFDKGLVTARDPALLNPGEVQRAINSIYRPSSPGLWKAPGRATYNSSAMVAAVKGLRYLRFDTTQVLVAHVEDDYYSSVLDDESGAFASLATAVGTGATLESVFFNKKHYLLNGNTGGVGNQVAKLDDVTGAVTTRSHGMIPVSTVPTLALSTGAGWPDNIDFGAGWYFIFYTEVIGPDGADEIESALADGTIPPTLFLPNFDDGITVTFSATKVNSAATHRRVYIVGPKESGVWNPFFLVEARALIDIPFSQTTLTFGITSAVSTREDKNPATITSSAGWTNPNNALTFNLSHATADWNGRIIIFEDFAWAGGYAAVHGLYLRVLSYGVDGPPQTVIADLSWDAGVTWTTPQYISPSGSQFDLVRSAGGQTDRWGRTWAAAEFSDANFRLRLTTQGGSTSATLRLDSVHMSLWHGASTGVEPVKGAFYPTTSVRIGPAVTVLSAHMPPPISSTGDIFESALVLNSVSADTTMYWSLIEEPDYFPSIYQLTFPVADKIKVIRRINNVLVVGMNNHIFRVNYLPTAESLSMDVAICYEPIAEDHGFISTQGYALFAPDGSSAQLAYVSATGLRYTNGLSTTTLTEDIDWAAMVNVSKLDKSILINDPNLASLIFYFIPAGDSTSTYPTRALYLSYHSTKIKEGGKLAVAGPVTVDVGSSTIGYVANLPILFTGNSTGTVSVEDRGEGSEEMDILSRDIYPDAIGGSFRANKHWIRFSSSDPGVLLTITPFLKNANRDYYTPADNGQWSQKSFRNNITSRIPGDTLTPRNLGGLAKLSGDFSAESFALRFQSSQVVGQAVGGIAISGYGFEAKTQGENEG